MPRPWSFVAENTITGMDEKKGDIILDKPKIMFFQATKYIVNISTHSEQSTHYAFSCHYGYSVAFDRFEKRTIYLSFQQSALEKARTAYSPETRKSWELAAETWRMLAELIAERCFCGRIAEGAKYYQGGQGSLLQGASA